MTTEKTNIIGSQVIGVIMGFKFIKDDLELRKRIEGENEVVSSVKSKLESKVKSE